MILGSGNNLVDAHEAQDNIRIIHVKLEPIVICKSCGKEVEEIQTLRNGGCCDHCAEHGEIK